MDIFVLASNDIIKSYDGHLTHINKGFPGDDVVKVGVSNRTPSISPVVSIKHEGGKVTMASFLCQA